MLFPPKVSLVNTQPSYAQHLAKAAVVPWPRFHVDDMSSAHVYLRLPEGAKLDDIPPEALEDCAQLVKHNSIQGAHALDSAVIGLRVSLGGDFRGCKQIKKACVLGLHTHTTAVRSLEGFFQESFVPSGE